VKVVFNPLGAQLTVPVNCLRPQRTLYRGTVLSSRASISTTTVWVIIIGSDSTNGTGDLGSYARVVLLKCGTSSILILLFCFMDT
jgi:hypothetical protein